MTYSVRHWWQGLTESGQELFPQELMKLACGGGRVFINERGESVDSHIRISRNLSQEDRPVGKPGGPTHACAQEESASVLQDQVTEPIGVGKETSVQVPAPAQFRAFRLNGRVVGALIGYDGDVDAASCCQLRLLEDNS